MHFRTLFATAPLSIYSLFAIFLFSLDLSDTHLFFLWSKPWSNIEMGWVERVTAMTMCQRAEWKSKMGANKWLLIVEWLCLMWLPSAVAFMSLWPHSWHRAPPVICVRKSGPTGYHQILTSSKYDWKLESWGCRTFLGFISYIQSGGRMYDWEEWESSDKDLWYYW